MRLYYNGRTIEELKKYLEEKVRDEELKKLMEEKDKEDYEYQMTMMQGDDQMTMMQEDNMSFSG